MAPAGIRGRSGAGDGVGGQREADVVAELLSHLLISPKRPPVPVQSLGVGTQWEGVI